MWTDFKPHPLRWNLVPSNLDAQASPAERVKTDYEVRVLNILLPAIILDGIPVGLVKRESPDFEVETVRGSLFVEVVDAVPVAVSLDDSMNLAKRRSRENDEPYSIDSVEFAHAVTEQIEKKCLKASAWVSTEPSLRGALVLLVNAGQAPLSIVEYFRDPKAREMLVGSPGIAPFIAVVVGDETGAFVFGTVQR